MLIESELLIRKIVKHLTGTLSETDLIQLYQRYPDYYQMSLYLKGSNFDLLVRACQLWYLYGSKKLTDTQMSTKLKALEDEYKSLG